MSPQQPEHQSSRALDFALTVHPVQNDGPATNEENLTTEAQLNNTETEAQQQQEKVKLD